MKEKIISKDNKNIRYDSEGNTLIYIGNRIWIREKDLPSREEVREEFMRYNYPIIYISEVILNIFIPIMVISIMTYIEYINFDINFIRKLLIYFSIYVFLRMKSIIIFTIKIYQLFAPLDVRSRCCLTPTCSQYSILCIKKYGVIIGCIKSIIRLRKCNGQKEEDYP